MLKIDCLHKAEASLEQIRKKGEVELQRIKSEFPKWPLNDVRRWIIIRFASMVFVPVLGLYIMRVHLSHAEWWEAYAPQSGNDLLEPGSNEFDRTIKGKLIIDLVGNLEHSFRLILGQLDSSNKASDFSALYNSLFRPTKPYLKALPSDWQSPLKLLRHIRNTVHNAWMYSPESGKDAAITYKGKAYNLVVGKSLDFISWDMLVDLAEDVLRIILAVVRDDNVKSCSAIPDPGAGIAIP